MDPNATTGEPCLLTHERPVFANDDAGNSVEHDRAAAHGARRERRVQSAGPIDECGVTAGIFERVHLAVQDSAATLNASIVAAADDFAVVDDDRADWDAAFGQSL